MRKPYERNVMTEETSPFKKMLAEKLDPDKLAIGLITTVAGWMVSAAVATAYTKIVIEPKSLTETTD
jgi:hypothetical protein